MNLQTWAGSVAVTAVVFACGLTAVAVFTACMVAATVLVLLWSMIDGSGDLCEDAAGRQL